MKTGRIWVVTIVVALALVGGAAMMKRDKAGTAPVPVAVPPAAQSPQASAQTGVRPQEAPKRKLPSAIGKVSGKMELAIPVLTEREGRLPLTYTCHSHNISPPLEWGGAPAGTKSFVLMLVKDADPPFTGWAVFNIPADFTGLDENVPKKSELENGIRHARSHHDASEYVGPCEPQGQFNYAFRLYALDVMVSLEAGVPAADLEAAMKGHILDTAEARFLHYLRF